MSPFFVAILPFCTSLCTSLGNKEGFLQESVNFFRSSNYGKFKTLDYDSFTDIFVQKQLKRMGKSLQTIGEG